MSDDPIRDALDRAAPMFEEGGKLEVLYPIYELQDTVLYTPSDVTATGSHLRDGIDLKRMMIDGRGRADALHPVRDVQHRLPGVTSPSSRVP